MANVKATTTEKSFSFKTVAMLCCIILKNGTIGGAQYDMMSALDGERTASAFQHEFRAVLKRAKELKDSMDKDGVPAPVTPKATRVDGGAGKKTPKTSGKKRGEYQCCAVLGRVLTLLLQVLLKSKRRKTLSTVRSMRSLRQRGSRLSQRLRRTASSSRRDCAFKVFTGSATAPLLRRKQSMMMMSTTAGRSLVLHFPFHPQGKQR